MDSNDPDSFEHPEPQFIRDLDRDRKKALNAFAVRAYQFLRRHPAILAQPKDVQHDIIQECILRFICSNCRVLRGYKDEGKPFKNWFRVVATRRAYDILGKEGTMVKRTPDIVAGIENGNKDIEEFLHKLNQSDYDLTEVVERVKECLRQLSAKCRALLIYAAEGYSAKELEGIIAPPRTNVQIANDLRYCRRLLRHCLANTGIEITDYL